MLFGELLVPGWLLSKEQIDTLIKTAREVVAESGTDEKIERFLEDAEKLRAVHNAPVRLRDICPDEFKMTVIEGGCQKSSSGPVAKLQIVS